MYYYGYNSGYPVNYAYQGYGYNTSGYSAAIILVLFILLVIIFGAGFYGNQGNRCN